VRVIVASTVVPFIEGGGTFIVDWLDTMLKRHGHEVDTLKLPFLSTTSLMLEQMLSLRLMHLGDRADRLICIRPPAHLLRHPQKVLWFIHHHRQVYDLWDTPYRDVADTPSSRRHAAAIIRADEVAFAESRAIFTNSRVVGDRLRRFNNVDSEVVYPPVVEPWRFRSDEYGDYVLYMSRVALNKRQHLVIEAMQHTRTPVKLVIAGPADSDAYANDLRESVERHGLGDRVRFEIRWLTEEEKVEWLAGCLSTVYVPFDEDSYGYPSLEAHHARKSVITTTDAGGTRELIVDGENGFMVPATPEALADAMDRLYLDRAMARRMGEAGPDAIERLGVTWDRVLERLLA
jgi:glycosyltransferase involved in cell wall biosynthesis